jgi:GT2 family glycosyltransferase
MSGYIMFIPYVNRIDLLRKAIESASDVRDHLVIIDNSKDGLEGEHGWPAIIRPLVPLSFSQSMNAMLKLAKDKGASICVWMHSDAEAEQGVVMELIALAHQYMAEGRKWGVLWTAYDALSAMNVEAFEDIGGWDANIAWYTSDNDAYYRLKLAGWECIDTGLKVKHTPSSTLNSDPEIRKQVDVMVPIREYYYQAKWGNSPGKEIYTVPFGGK